MFTHLNAAITDSSHRLCSTDGCFLRINLFNFSKIEFLIELLDKGAPEGFWGPRIRGLYGSALLDLLCDHGPMSDYRQCSRFGSCFYPFLFESNREARREFLIADRSSIPVVEGKPCLPPARRDVPGGKPLPANDLPPPYVITAPSLQLRASREGDMVSFGFVALGDSCSLLGLTAEAFARFGAKGFRLFGNHSIRYRLRDVKDLLDSGRSIYGDDRMSSYVTCDIEEAVGRLAPSQIPGEITVEFVTPARVSAPGNHTDREREKVALLTDFYGLVYNLIFRVEGLRQVYDKDWVGGKEYYARRESLLQASKTVSAIDVRLRTYRDDEGQQIKHRSYRQGDRRLLSGFIGTMRFAGDLAPFWNLLRIGEVVHIGRDTANGLGQYRLVF